MCNEQMLMKSWAPLTILTEHWFITTFVDQVGLFGCALIALWGDFSGSGPQCLIRRNELKKHKNLQ